MQPYELVLWPVRLAAPSYGSVMRHEQLQWPQTRDRQQRPSVLAGGGGERKMERQEQVGKGRQQANDSIRRLLRNKATSDPGRHGHPGGCR